MTLLRYLPLSFWAFFLLALCMGGGAVVAQEQTVSVLRHGVVTALTLPEYKSQGVGYASMRDVARQLGASIVVSDARATFRLDGKIAEAGLNDTEVHGAETPFSLRHPILAYDSDALIAMEDVAPFLRKAFGFGTPEEPPSTSALSSPREVPAPLPSENLEDTMESDTLEAVTAPPPTPNKEEAPTELEAIEISSSPLDTQQVAPLSFPSGSSFLLAIDPGHGGEDAGVAGANGLLEKEFCLAVATNLRRILKEQYGIATIMTRDNDESMSAVERLNRATNAQATLILSIHGGASSTPEAHGYQVFSHKRKRSLSTDPKHALKVAQALNTTLDQATKQLPRPVREISLLLARESNLPCILVELGNLTNPDDAEKLSAPAHQKMLATALAKGIDAVVGPRSSP